MRCLWLCVSVGLLFVGTARSEETPEGAASVAAFRKAIDGAGLADSPMMVGFASSMEKVLPRDVPFDVTVARQVAISLARNEKESFQVAVMPRDALLRKVSVTVGDLKSESGAVFSAENVDCDVMGYVETVKRPPYKVDHVGGGGPTRSSTSSGRSTSPRATCSASGFACERPRTRPPGRTAAGSACRPRAPRR